MITYDCIGNYIFLADHDLCHSNTSLSLTSEHYSEEEVIVFYDHKLITKEQESHQYSGRKAVIEVQLFHEYQQISDISFKDPVAAYIESYISENMKNSDFLILSVFPNDFGFVNNFLSLLLHFKHQVLMSDRDKFSSIFKFLELLLWKSTFT